LITTVALLKAKDGLSREAFVDYYENHHVPLVLSVAPPPVRYVRSYLPECSLRGFAADFDVVTQLGFADEAARRAWLGLVLAEESGVAADEARFLDRARTRSWVVDERSSAPLS